MADDCDEPGDLTRVRPRTPNLPPTRSRRAHTYNREEVISAIPSLLQQLLGSGSLTYEKINSGVSSLNYLVTHGTGQYIVRFDLFRSIAELNIDLRLSREAARWGVTTLPNELHVGDLYGLPVVVRPFIPGRALDPMKKLDAPFMAMAGRELGLLHTCPARSERRWFYAEAVSEPDRIRSGIGDLQSKARAIVNECHGLLTEHRISRSGLIHTDFKSDNLIRSGDRIHVIDWEKATTGPQLFDLGLALFHLVALEDEVTAWSRTRAFLSGYRAANPLTDTELNVLPEFICYAASIFFLIDAEINELTSASVQKTDVGTRHAAYYRNYCIPAFSRLLARQNGLRAMEWLR